MEGFRLQMKNIQKFFPGLRALDGVDFDLKPGEVHALIGINGAGKSTLIKIMSGVYQKDGGEIYIDGKRVSIKSTHEAIRLGISTVYQYPDLVPSFSGYENIYLGAETDREGWLSPINRKRLKEKAQALLQQFPVNIDLTRPVKELGQVEQETISILNALSKEMQVLILDEPTSILTEKEKEVLFELIKLLKAKGVSIIYISHRLEEIEQIADRLTILRDGMRITTMEVSKAMHDHLKIAEMMLGKKLEKLYPEKNQRFGEELFSVESLSLDDYFQDISFSVKQGEILGVFGLVGSGIDVLSKVLFGVFPPSKGKMRLHNKAVNLKSPKDAIRKGLFLIPGNRKVEGLIEFETIYFNVTLSKTKKISRFLGLVDRKKENEEVENLCHFLQVATPSIALEVNKLSGGNQQKVVLAKGIFTEARVYIIHEPTVGVDVGAKVGIYKEIRDLTKSGAVIVISSDCEEVYGLCDHAMAIWKGRTVLDKSVNDLNRREMLLCGVKGNLNG